MLWRSVILIINTCAEDWAQPFQRKPLPQSLSSSAFGVKCILPAQSSSSFTTRRLQALLSAEAGITHPVPPYANVLPSPGWQSRELESRLLEMPSVRAKDSHRVPLGPGFSADSAPAGLWAHWSSWSLRSCIFWWGPESETASLHLARHSPSSHLLRGNVCHRRGGRYRDSANLPRAPGCAAPSRGALRRGCLEHTELLPPQQGHRSSGVIGVTCQRSGAALLPSIPPHLQEEFGISCANPANPGCDEGFSRQKHCYWCGWELKQSKAASNLRRITKKSIILEKP